MNNTRHFIIRNVTRKPTFKIFKIQTYDLINYTKYDSVSKIFVDPKTRYKVSLVFPL